MDENVWEEVIQVNPAQAAFLVMPYKNDMSSTRVPRVNHSLPVP